MCKDRHANAAGTFQERKGQCGWNTDENTGSDVLHGPQPVDFQPAVLTSGGLRRPSQAWNFLPVEASAVVEGPLD